MRYQLTRAATITAVFVLLVAPHVAYAQFVIR